MNSKPDQYYRHGRPDVDPVLPALQGLSILELGCGEGATGARLKGSLGAERVDGVEISPEAAATARLRLDDVTVASLADFTPGRCYDVVLALDVLEHLQDPATVLERIVSKGLKPGGALVTSMPNVRYWRIVYDLAVRGVWEYDSKGILDTTHLRFFTRSTIESLHRSAGCTPDAILWPEISGKRRWIDRMTGGRFREFLSGQCVVRSRKLA